MENKTEELKSLKPGVEKLCDEHWEYVRGVLTAGEEPIEAFSTLEKKLEVIEFHYKTAFGHGYGHGKESVIKSVETAQRIINHAILETRFPSLRKDPIEKGGTTITNAQKIIRDAFEADEDFKRDYINNLAMFLHDRCGVTNLQERNKAAEDLLRIIFY